MLQSYLHKLVFKVLAIGLMSLNCLAYQTPYEIAATVSCNNDLNRHYYINEYTAQFGKPYKEEGGALWFKVTTGENLYDAPIKELFVSTHPEYLFVGVVIEATPEIIVEAIRSSIVLPTNLFQKDKDTWIGADTRTVMRYNGKYTKIFCLAGARN